jgi:hypothetical protein
MRDTLRKLITILAVITGFACFLGCANKSDRIIGEWKDNAQQGKSFVFDRTHHATMILENEVIGGKDLVGKHHNAELKYEVNYNHDPYWLDLVVYEAGTTNELARIKGIFRFISNNKMELRMNMDPGGNRFSEFDRHDEDNTVVLDKVSQ